MKARNLRAKNRGLIKITFDILILILGNFYNLYVKHQIVIFY